MEKLTLKEHEAQLEKEAKEPKKRAKSSGIFILKHKEIIASIASPAPTLSRAELAKAGQ